MVQMVYRKQDFRGFHMSKSQQRLEAAGGEVEDGQRTLKRETRPLFLLPRCSLAVQHQLKPEPLSTVLFFHVLTAMQPASDQAGVQRVAV